MSDTGRRAVEDDLRRLYDHLQRIHGIAPSDLGGRDPLDVHEDDHNSPRFQHEWDDLFLYIDEEHVAA